MSKMIKLSKEYIDKCVSEFREFLVSEGFSDGNITYKKHVDSLDRKATVLVSEIAYLKMQALVREFDKEVAWHGLACRCKEPDTYCITDILVYPQAVTGSTVVTDQERYQTWLAEQEDFDHIRMQGHSHVNLGVSPSAVDEAFYKNIIGQLGPDMFYIFMILNKSGNKTVMIYDFKENIFFETEDITVKVTDDGTGIKKFLEEAKEAVTEKSTVVMSSADLVGSIPAYDYTYRKNRWPYYDEGDFYGGNYPGVTYRAGGYGNKKKTTSKETARKGKRVKVK